MKPSSLSFDDANAVKCELAGEVLRSSGTLRLRVMGWSMLPAVWPGDTVVVKHVESSAVSAGDIVLFSRNRRFFVHRVVATEATADAAIIARGDAMSHADPPVAARDLLGKVSCILRIGKCIEPRKTPRFSERAVAALVRNSEIAARVVVGVHGMRQTS